MPYRLRAKETVPEGIRRVVDEEIASAVSVLEADRPAPRDESIHEARKSVKKIRGVLRLMRPELGSAYRGENARFRAIGRKLSELRDAAALLEIFDQMAGKGGEPPARRRKIRRGLELEKQRIEKKLDAGRVAATAAEVFRREKTRIAHWPLRRDGFAALAPGLKQTYRRGRRALKAARQSVAPENFHDLRKRVKDHWYHVRLLESGWTETMRAREAHLKELETWLGDDHNLAGLRETLERHPERFGGEESVRALLPEIEARQGALRQNALALAGRLYSEKPEVFVQSIEDMWEAWQRQPAPRKSARPALSKAPELTARAG